MQQWPPGAPSSEKATQYDHSPYCESRGPIVQEGFVAGRIKALQALQARAQAGTHSHSPIFQCQPTRTWKRTPKDEFNNITKSVAHTDARSFTSLAISLGRERSARITKAASSEALVQSQDMTDKTPMGDEVSVFSLPEIQAPRPLSADWANASVLADTEEEQISKEGKHSNRWDLENASSRLGTSVADHLGSLVEGRVTAIEAFNETDDNRKDGKISARSNLGVTEADNTADNSGVDLREELQPSVINDATPNSRTTTLSDRHYGSKQATTASNEQVSEHIRDLSFQRSTLKAGELKARTPLEHSDQEKQDWSLKNSPRPKVESRQNTIGLQIPATGSHFPTTRLDAVSQGTPKPKMSHESLTSPPTHERPHTKLTSSATNSWPRNAVGGEFSPPGSRSTSWFRRSWLRSFTGNLSSESEKPLEVKAENAKDSTIAGRSQPKPHPQSKQHLEDMNVTLRGVSESDTKPPTSNSILKEQIGEDEGIVQTPQEFALSHVYSKDKVRGSLQDAKGSQPASLLDIINSKSCAGSTEALLSKSPSASSSSSQYSSHSGPIPVPERRSSKWVSKRSSIASVSSKAIFNTPPNQTPQTRKRSRVPSPTSSTPRPTERERSSSPSKQLPRRSRPRPRANPDSEPAEQLTPDVDYAHQGLKGKGERVKKIQVIISFDGADDLVIEAAAGTL